MNLQQAWSDMVFNTLLDSPEAYVQIRKMYQHRNWEVDWKTFQTGSLLSFPQMGYKDNKSKMKQLERNYFNEEELTRMRDVFLNRLNSSGNKSLQTCVSARMGNKEKDSRSQGYCMQTLTVNYLNNGKSPRIFLELHYRSTELTQKFLADLVFLRERVFPFIMEGWPEDVVPDGVRFNFSTCYISLMFMPVYYQATGIVSMLNYLKVEDYKYYKMVISALSRLMIEECSYNYRTRVNMHELFWREVHPKLKRKQIKEINKLIREYKK